MAQRVEDVLLLTRRHMECLASPARAEIIRALRAIGAASVTQIADATGRSATSLYYHLNHLIECGLIFIDHTRKAGKREEAVYAVVSKMFQFDEKETDPEYRRAAGRYVSASMRALDRRYQGAIKVSAQKPEAFAVNFFETVNIKLTEDGLARLREGLKAALQAAREDAVLEGGRRIACGVMITPVL